MSFLLVTTGVNVLFSNNSRLKKDDDLTRKYIKGLDNASFELFVAMNDYYDENLLEPIIDYPPRWRALVARVVPNRSIYLISNIS